MNKILIPQAVITVLGSSLLALFTAPFQSISFLVGSLVILLSFILLGIGWSLIFQKKLVALAGFVIVFKYAILGIIIYTIVKRPWFNPLWFAMGVASFVLSAIVYAVTESLREGNEHGGRTSSV